MIRRLAMLAWLTCACTSREHLDAGTTPRDAGAIDPTRELRQLQADVDAIFTASCATCHAWSTWTVVNAGSNCGGPGQLVVPFDVAASRLYGKVAHAPACGSAMPPQASLSPPAIAAIRFWIERGAPLGGQVSKRVARPPEGKPVDLDWRSAD